MNILLFKIKQSGVGDAIPTQLINQISNFVDDAIRVDIGKYNARLSDDILVENTIKSRATLIGTTQAQKISASFGDVNIILIKTFDANDNPCDLGGEALIAIESPNTIFQ